MLQAQQQAAQPQVHAVNPGSTVSGYSDMTTDPMQVRSREGKGGGVFRSQYFGLGLGVKQEFTYFAFVRLNFTALNHAFVLQMVATNLKEV